ncbi:MAG TPA: lipid-A-disaccharide synthase [Candidatus Binataceae bacterium]|nr:lipid-A-disaccharide synthase [Candidatus Binataceae bacterium]
MPANAEAQVSPAQAVAARRRILIVAGEASGDLHGGDLAREIFARDPDCELFGIAGENMRAAGVKALVRMEDIHGMGLSELASTIGRTVGVFGTLRRIIRNDKPDLVILIDYAEFNLILSGVAKRAGVPVLYYITPQVWAWRRGRVAKLVDRAARLAVVLPFEAELYRTAGDRVTFVGHPLLDRVQPAQNRVETLKRHGFPSGARLIAILPGSRRAEVRHLMRPMAEAARILARDHDLVPVVALAPTLTPDELGQIGRADLTGIRIIEGDTYSIIAASEIALVASGTATLETALLGCPEVIAYKVSPLTYILGRMLITGVDFIGMPNILADRRIVPELIQGEVTAQRFVRAAEPMLSPSIRAETVANLRAIREKLGEPGAAGRAADIVIGMVQCNS